MGCCNPNPDNVSQIVPIKGAKAGAELEVSKPAAQFILDLLKRENRHGQGLRIDVIPGGCAGFQYYMDFEETARPGDHEFEFHGVKIFVSEESFAFIRGSSIDFVQTLQETGLKVNNPNIRKSCNCGRSVA